MKTNSIAELGRLFREKKLSPVEHACEAFEKIRRSQDVLHAFVYLTEEAAMAAARQAEQDFMSGIDRGPLQGITVGLKDLIWTRDAPVTMECQYYYEHPLHVPDSAVAERLRNQGAVILGKTNTHALGMGATGDTTWSACAVNPHDITRVTGGSSSGSAAAMSAHLCDLTFGHDSGGSVRIPAAICGVVGMKPTFGRVSKFGLSGLGLSCDCIGPLAGSVADSAVALSAVSGYDYRDMYSLKLPVENYSDYLTGHIRGLRVAVPMAWLLNDVLDEEIRSTTLSVIELLSKMGAQIVDVSQKGLMPDRQSLARYRDAHQTIMSTDGFMLHQEALREPDKLPDQALKRLLAGNTSALNRNQAYALRQELREIYHNVFKTADVFLTPTVAALPCKLHETDAVVDGELRPVYGLYSEFTWQASFAGLPSMSLPSGISRDGLPIGILLTAASLEEKTIFRTAAALEKELALDITPQYA